LQVATYANAHSKRFLQLKHCHHN